MAENSGKCFLAREISVFINLNRYFQLSVDCQNVKKVISNRPFSIDDLITHNPLRAAPSCRAIRAKRSYYVDER